MFEGFSPETSDFLWGISLNNDRTWFEAHRAEFERCLNQPFRALAADTLSRMAARWPEEDFQPHVARIYRDARRLYGRGPYKDRLWFTLQRGQRHPVGPMFWFEIDGTGYSCGMGFWEGSADLAAAFRASMDADPARFEALARSLPEDCRLWGDEYKRPKADRGPILNPWYNRKSVSVGWERLFGGLLYSPDLPEALTEDYSRLMPMYRYFWEVYDGLQAKTEGQRQLGLSE